MATLRLQKPAHPTKSQPLRKGEVWSPCALPRRIKPGSQGQQCQIPKGASHHLGGLSQVSFQPRSVARVLERNHLGVRDALGGQSHLLVAYSKSGGHCQDCVRLSTRNSHQTMGTGSGGCGQHAAATKVHFHPQGNCRKPVCRHHLMPH